MHLCEVGRGSTLQITAAVWLASWAALAQTPEQLAFLRRHRCDVGQGYLFDRPIPGRELAERLKRYPRGPVA